MKGAHPVSGYESLIIPLGEPPDSVFQLVRLYFLIVGLILCRSLTVDYLTAYDSSAHQTLHGFPGGEELVHQSDRATILVRTTPLYHSQAAHAIRFIPFEV